MPGGRPPKPAQIKTLEGNRGRRDIPPEVSADGLPEMPTGLCDVAAGHWRFVMAEVGKWGVAKRIDGALLERLCRYWALWQRAMTAVESDPLDKDAANLAIKYGDQWEKCASKLGMSPVDRAKLAIQEQKAEDPLKEWKTVG